MKIAVCLDDIRPEVGGGFTFQTDIASALIESAGSSPHSLTLYGKLPRSVTTASHPPNLEFNDEASAPGGRLGRWLDVCFPSFEFFRDSLGWKSRFERNLRRNGTEFVWFITPTHRPIDTPYVCTVWDLQHRRQPWFPEVSANGRWYFRDRSYERVLTRAVAVLAPNQAARDEVMNFYRIPAQRIVTLPHPTPSFALLVSGPKDGAVLAKYGIPDRFLFYPAQFWPHKNHVNLLGAIKMLKERHGIAQPVVFVGSDMGSLTHVRATAATYGLGPQVYFLGFVPREDLIALYHHALAMVYPTFFGPENLPPLEAFGLGCPVIASRVAGATEQLGDAALLFDPASVEEMTAAIRSICADTALRKGLSERGTARAMRWTSQDYVKEVFRLFDDFEKIRRCWPST